MNKNKTNAELLASFKKMNKIAKEKHLVKAGFTSAALYIAFLEKNAIKPKSNTVKKTVASDVVIHIVDILDKSGSMNNTDSRFSPSKITTALSAINEGIEDLRAEKKITYTYSLCLFSTDTNINIIYNKANLSTVGPIQTMALGGTALYDAIGETINTVSKNIAPQDKVLVNIYTDGEENSSRRYSKASISKLIEASKEKGFTVTFIGTEIDTKNVVKDLNIHESNTLAYNGSSAGLKTSMNVHKQARAMYSSAAVKGEDVSQGFYKNIIKK